MNGLSRIKLWFVFLSIVLLLNISCTYRPRGDSRKNPSRTRTERIENKNDRTVLPMDYKDGVYYINIEVNDVPMKFIFDTGASIISISQTEAIFLQKQGTLTESDFKHNSYFTDANGDTIESVIVNLRKIKIGHYILENVEASIVPNQIAPLLFGQSALKQFRKISIDNKINQLIIEP